MMKVVFFNRIENYPKSQTHSAIKNDSKSLCEGIENKNIFMLINSEKLKQ